MKRTIFLMLAVLLSALSASAYDFMVDGIAYKKMMMAKVWQFVHITTQVTSPYQRK